ncbi:MAG: hypothetical protein U0521_29140 [Anaerolineae bacterium]
MTRLIALLAVGLALAFAAVLAAAQAQPLDDDLRAFLLPPENCPAPCWEGVRPGVTTLDEAVALLEANPWVGRVVVRQNATFTFLYVEWSDQAPAFVENADSQLPTYLWVRNDIIQLILIPTRIPFGEIWLRLGAPSRGSFAVSGYRHSLTLGNRPNTRHVALYYDGQVTVDTRVYCPVSLALFWSAPATITYSAPAPQPAVASQPYDLARWLFAPPCQS